MAVCFYPRNKQFSLRGPERFRVIDDINLTYYMNKSELDKIMQHILSEFCNTSVIGYNKYQDKFWCKRYDKSICTLHIEIFVNLKGFEYSEIKLTPLIGTTDDINMFVYDFNDSIQMYRTSNFIRSVLSTY